MMIDASTANRYYYHYDGLGSVVALSNNDGEIIETYSYDVFGTATIRDNNCSVISVSSVAKLAVMVVVVVEAVVMVTAAVRQSVNLALAENVKYAVAILTSDAVRQITRAILGARIQNQPVIVILAKTKMKYVPDVQG